MELNHLFFRGLDCIKGLSSIVFSKTPAFTDVEKANAFLSTVHPDLRSSGVRNERSATANHFDLSIILPTYNRSSLLSHTIDSILHQKTHYHYELIIINDGSRDDTQDVLRAYQNLDNVVIINQNNTGISGARNSGLEIASGEYIMFVDDDDKLADRAIETLMTAARTHKADLVEGAFVRVRSDGKRIKEEKKQVGMVQCPVGTLTGFPCGKVFHRKLFKRVQFPVGYWFEDTIDVMLLFPQAERVLVMNDAVYEYLLNSNGISQMSKTEVKSIDSLYVFRQLLKDKIKLGLPIDQSVYEEFLRMVYLTYTRTRLLDEPVKCAIFAVWCGIKEYDFAGFSTGKSGYIQSIETCLLKKNYRRFALHCELKL